MTPEEIKTSGMPKGGDIADMKQWGWSAQDVLKFAVERAQVVQPTEQHSQADSTEAPPPSSPSEPASAPIPPSEFPPEATLTEKPPKRPRPKLAVVGNNALAPEVNAEALPASLSEDALADHFAVEHGQDWRHVKRWGAWFEWDGDGWRQDEVGKVNNLAVSVTRKALYWPEGIRLTDKEKRQINRRSTAGALRDIAADDPRIRATIDQWDTDPWMLGCPGGVLDLRSATMLPPEREQYITKRTAVAPESGSPVRWLDYLKRAHAGDEETISYLQRYAGYSCTGETGEHALAFLYGNGRNGKGVFLETVSRVLGDYAKTASITTFLEQKNPAHSTELARLHKARLVVTEEAGVGGRWNESRIKHMTGGGKITARFMRMDDFEFTPCFKLLVAANHKPSLRSVDEAMKARIHLVPFNVTIPPEERDLNLLDKLQTEWPQILGWMLDGCAEWQRIGLKPPQRILDATSEYMQQEDILGDWIAENCNSEGEVDAADAFQNYRKWCDASGHSAWSRIGWSRAVMERGTIDSRRSSGRTIFIGLSLKPTQF